MKPKHLTVVEWHHLGDAVMAVPFIRGACRAGIHVSLCATPGPAEVFRFFFPDLPLAVFDPGVHAWWRGKEWLDWREGLRPEVPETAVCAWADPRVHVWMKQAGYARRVGLPVALENCYAREAALLRPHFTATRWLARGLESWAGPLLTESWSRETREQHHQDNWKGLAGLLDFQVDVAGGAPKGAGAVKSSERKNRGPEESKKTGWVIHPGGRLRWKRWSVENWEDLLARMARVPGLRTILVQGPGIPVLSRLPEGQEVCQTEHVSDLAALISRAEGLVGLDSFPAHLAAALGKKTLVLLGDMPVCWFAPRGELVRCVVSHRTNRPLRAYRAKKISLLHAVSVYQVMESFQKLQSGAAVTARLSPGPVR